MTRATPSEIKASYEGKDLASGYVQRRFQSELGLLLHRKQIEAVRTAIEQTQPDRVLEIAPGPGRLTRDIHAPGEHWCLEFNQGMIEVGKASCGPHVRWVRGDAFALPFAEPFDLVYTFRFIRHFKDADRRRLYEQVRNALRPGGLFLMDAVNAVVSRPMREQNPQNFPIYDVLYDSLDDLKRELAKAGLPVRQVVEVQKRYDLQFKVQNLVGPRSRWLTRAIIHALERTSRGPCLEWIVTCARE